MSREFGEHLVEDALAERGVGVHLALGLQLGRPLLDQPQRLAHLARAGRVGRAEAGVGQERQARLEAEAAHLLGAEQGDVGELGRASGRD